MLEIAINAGSKDCVSNADMHEVISEKEDFYKVKSEIEKKIDNFIYSGIEWRAHNYITIPKEQNESIIFMLEALEEDDNVQNTYINYKIEMN